MSESDCRMSVLERAVAEAAERFGVSVEDVAVYIASVLDAMPGHFRSSAKVEEEHSRVRVVYNQPGPQTVLRRAGQPITSKSHPLAQAWHALGLTGVLVARKVARERSTILGASRIWLYQMMSSGAERHKHVMVQALWCAARDAGREGYEIQAVLEEYCPEFIDR